MNPRALSTDFADRLPAGTVFPDYGGGSILNLPATLGALLGVADGWSAPPLHPWLLDPLAGDWRRVILLLIDGVGWNRLERELREHDAGYLELDRQFGLGRTMLTSVSPSTTSVATTSLLGNGAAPAEHGMLGYTYWLPALGRVANALFWKPASELEAPSGALERLGFPPETFLATPSLFAVLAQGGVSGRALLPNYITHSPLSRMQFRGTEVGGYDGIRQLFARLAAWQDTTKSRSFAYGYLPDFDAQSHRDGPDAGSWSELWQVFVPELTRFVAQLDVGTLLLVTADHGHVHTPPDKRLLLQHLPEVERLCRCPPGGEARHVYLYCASQAKDELLSICRERMSDAFLVLDGVQALAGGLYGPADRLHPEAMQRVGDVVLLARGGASFWDAGNDAVLLGMHGSLEADEMLVPLAAFTTC